MQKEPKISNFIWNIFYKTRFTLKLREIESNKYFVQIKTIKFEDDKMGFK